MNKSKGYLGNIEQEHLTQTLAIRKTSWREWHLKWGLEDKQETVGCSGSGVDRACSGVREEHAWSPEVRERAVVPLLQKPCTEWEVGRGERWGQSTCGSAEDLQESDSVLSPVSLSLCSVDVPCKARATENFKNQVYLMPRSSNVSAEVLQVSSQRNGEGVPLTLLETPPMVQSGYWHASLVPAWAQQEVHSTVSSVMACGIQLLLTLCVHLLLSSSRHLQSKIMTIPHAKILTAVSELSLDYRAQSIFPQNICCLGC